MNTRVARLVDKETIRVTEEPVHEPGEHEVIVELKRCGICGSDLNYFRHAGLGSHKKELPLDMGHEPAGIVVDSGPSGRFEEGTRVAVDPGLPCGECLYCRQGKHNLCQEGEFMGSDGASAAFREYITVSEEQLIDVEGLTGFDEAALVEPLSVPLHMLENLIDVGITDDVAVIGAGPIGLLTIELLHRSGTGTVFAVDPLDHRVEYALEHGADVGITDAESAESEIRRRCDGGGVDFAIEAAGDPGAFDSAMKAARPGGTVVLVGIPPVDHVDYNPHKARIKELSVINVRRSNRTMRAAADVLMGNPDMDEMVTHHYPLEEIQEAFEVTAAQEDDVIKTVIEM